MKKKFNPYDLNDVAEIHAGNFSKFEEREKTEDPQSRPTKRPADALPVERCEHGNLRGKCYVEVCSFSKPGERR